MIVNGFCKEVFKELPMEFGSPIRQVAVSEGGIVVVEQSGRCWILDSDTFAPTFQYNAPGMNKLILAFGDNLIGAKTDLSAFSGPLLQINRRTGETVPIKDPSLFVYDLFYATVGGGIDVYYCQVVGSTPGNWQTLYFEAQGVDDKINFHAGPPDAMWCIPCGHVEYDEDAKRFTFRAAGLPRIITLSQNTTTVVPTGEGTCRVVFQIHMELLAPFAILSPLLKKRLAKGISQPEFLRSRMTPEIATVSWLCALL